MPLSSQSIEEIRLIISQRNTSPRGVADSNFFDSSSSNEKNNNVKGTPSQADIDKYTSEFITGVMTIAVTYMEYRRSLTIVPSDVAAALNTFASQTTYNVDASENDDKFTQWTVDDDMDEDDIDEAMDVDIKIQDVEKVRIGMIQLQAIFRGKQVRDREVLYYDSGSDMDEDDNDDGYDEDDTDEEQDNNQTNFQNLSTPIFDSVYSPVENISLKDEEFKNQTFLPIFNGEDTDNVCRIHICNSHLAIGDGIKSEDDAVGGEEMVVMGLMKRATYAFLVNW